MEAVSLDLEGYQELKYRGCGQNMHSTEITNDDAVSVCPWAPRAGVLTSGLYSLKCKSDTTWSGVY